MEHSPKYEKIKTYYELGYWTEEMVKNAVKKGTSLVVGMTTNDQIDNNIRIIKGEF